GADLVQVRTAQVAAPRAWLPRADRLVIRVEEVGVPLVHRTVARDEAGEHEGLEEPGRVGEVPLGRAGVGHRLDELVLGGKGRGQRGGRGAHGRVVLPEAGGPRLRPRPRPMNAHPPSLSAPADGRAAQRRLISTVSLRPLPATANMIPSPIAITTPMTVHSAPMRWMIPTFHSAAITPAMKMT